MRLSSLTYLAFETNAVLDACPGLKLPFAEIHEAADRGALVEHLAKRFGKKADLSLLLTAPEELKAVNSALFDVAGGLYGQERRKFGVEKSGLCLVLAFILEAIQRQLRIVNPPADTEPCPETQE